MAEAMRDSVRRIPARALPHPPCLVVICMDVSASRVLQHLFFLGLGWDTVQARTVWTCFPRTIVDMTAVITSAKRFKAASDRGSARLSRASEIQIHRIRMSNYHDLRYPSSLNSVLEHFKSRSSVFSLLDRRVWLIYYECLLGTSDWQLRAAEKTLYRGL